MNLNKLAEITGKGPKTVRRRLEGLPAKKGPNRSLLWDSREALPLIFGIAEDGETRLDAQQERAKLDKARRELVELELSRKAGELVQVGTVHRLWDHERAIVRARLLAMPSKLAGICEHRPAPEIAESLKVEVYAALDELSDRHTYSEESP